METGIHVGNKINMAEAAPPLADALVQVLAAISDHRIDRETAGKALDVLGMAASGAPTTITNSTITGGGYRPTPSRTRFDVHSFDVQDEEEDEREGEDGAAA